MKSMALNISIVEIPSFFELAMSISTDENTGTSIFLLMFIPSIFFRIISSKVIKTNLFVFSSKYFSILDLFIQTSSKRYFIHKIFLSTIIKRYYSFMVFQIPFGFYIVDNIKFK